MPKGVPRLHTIARLINDRCRGFHAEVVEGYCSTDTKIAGTRLRRPGKGRRGNRLVVYDRKGRIILDHNSAVPYRTNSEVLEKIEARWGRIWERERE
jgi:hypothetical protein